MNPLCSASLSLILGWVGVAGSALACPKVTLQTDDDFSQRWPNLPERIRGALAGREGIDTCARVKLGVDGKRIRVEVVLEDGRSASRSLQRSEDVIPTLEALLFVPRTHEAESDVKVEAEPEPEPEPEPQPEAEPEPRPAEPPDRKSVV